jgi:putative polyhydroxyalkanoate system protein
MLRMDDAGRGGGGGMRSGDSAAKSGLPMRGAAPRLAILPRHRDESAWAMSRIRISKQHHLTHKKAKDVAEKIARDLQKRFALEYAWNGDHVDFERPGLSGRMHVGADEISLDVNLGLLLSVLKPALEKEIHAQLDGLIGKRGGTRSA